jgi:hypothetical protein
MIERQFKEKIRFFPLWQGGEYKKLHNYFMKIGIHHWISCPYTHEQNGTAERKIRHLVDTTLTLLAHASLPLKFWHFALEQSNMLVNVLPSNVLLKQSPFEILFK